MKAYKCDICGKLYPQEESESEKYETQYKERGWKFELRIGKAWIPGDGRFSFDECDVCGDCKKAFTAFVKERRESPRAGETAKATDHI